MLRDIKKRVKKVVRREEGFTLLELAIVLTVIAILATLLAPNVVNIVDSAVLTGALSNARAIHSALNAFFSYQKPKQYPEAIADWNTLRSTLDDYIALPSDPKNANFDSFKNYTRPNRNTYELQLCAADSALTPILIQETGVLFGTDAGFSCP